MNMKLRLFLASFALLCSTAFRVVAANDIRVSGTVMSEGEPLAGASVLIKGTHTGTVTDADGHYSISVPSDGTLVFSFIGFQSQEHKVAGRSVINVELLSDSEELDEVMVVAYAMFPVMLGLSAIAEDMFAVFLGGEWMATVPYFEAVCLAGLFYPLGLVAYNVLKVKSGGALIVKLEVAKKVMMSVVFAVTIPVSVQAVIWGLVVIAFCEMAINFFATTRFTSFGAGRFVRTVLPMLLVAGAMYALVRVTALAVPGNALLRLLAEVAAGVVSYVLLSALFRLEAFREVVALARRQFIRK